MFVKICIHIQHLFIEQTSLSISYNRKTVFFVILFYNSHKVPTLSCIIEIDIEVVATVPAVKLVLPGVRSSL